LPNFESARRQRNLARKVVFLMQVREIVTFDQYWSDPAQQRFGDNIYHREDGKWV
jgi:hypothetical protein